MISLGIESSAYVFGVGIITEEGEILANKKAVYKPPERKGLIPTDAGNFHKNNSKRVLKDALEEAKLTLDDIDIISYTAGPGIPACLVSGANLAINLAKTYNKPLIQVHHGVGHVEIGRLTTGAKNPVVLYLSGGHTCLLSRVGTHYVIFGESEDITVANCFDVLAREMNLPSPGGPEIEKLAKAGKYVELPLVIKGMDVSFSGILTAAIKKYKEGISKEDIAYSVQETCFAMLTEVTERALAHSNKDEVLLVGGVAANKRLQEMLKIMCQEREAKLYTVPQEYSGDQGVQIAWCGLLHYKSHCIPKIKNKILPKWRIDEVPICWIK